MISDSTLQLTLKNYYLSIEVKCPVIENTIKMFLYFPNTYTYEAKYTSHTSTTTTQGNRLKVESDMKI